MREKLLKKENVSSREELSRCVWMTAGVISFKLCPLAFDCEHCDFDKVMRFQAEPNGMKSRTKGQISKAAFPSEDGGAADIPPEGQFFTFSISEFDERLHLYPIHIWAKHQGDHTWKIGVDELLAYVLPPVLRIEFDNPSQEITQGRIFGRIVTEVGTISLTAPLSGRLVGMNPVLALKPEIVQNDPWREGWLAEIELPGGNSELKRLYAGPQALQFLKEEAGHLKSLLKYRGIEVSQVGPTMPDGGSGVKHLYQILAPELCFRLARELVTSAKNA